MRRYTNRVEKDLHIAFKNKFLSVVSVRASNMTQFVRVPLTYISLNPFFTF